jgi:ectoine hydroxylase-related dioxygenase (phytanoyl-CoA dioxygenase family)
MKGLDMTFEEKINAIRTQGYVVLKNIISDEECNKYKQYLEEDYVKYSQSYSTGQQRTISGLEEKSSEKVVFNLHNKRLEYFELLGHPTVLKILDVILKEGSYKDNDPYYLYNISARSPKKGSEQQLHLDSRFPGSMYVLIANVIWVLDDFTKESGATRVVPGSHKSGKYAEDGVRYPDEILVEAPRGSVIIFDASLWHGSSCKKNDAERWAVVLGYSRWFRKPSYDFMKNTPRKIWSKLTAAQKELLGFRFIPPKDEFTRNRSISEEYEMPDEYEIPLPDREMDRESL